MSNDLNQVAGSGGPKVTLVRRAWHHRHRDWQPCDEVRITTVNRWKSSDLSGSEYRYHAKVEFMRKGRCFLEKQYGDVETAMRHAPVDLSNWLGEGNYGTVEDSEDCDQEGCQDKATVTYRLKKLVSREGYVKECGPHDLYIARFCDRHRRRGDCGLEDSDSNYEEVVVNPDGTVTR